jgi:aryl-alcohol dehydrogenase-like predicted oxidoreductase/3-hydroxyisobutyrate dehydrogenase-like beta-hydroxyacid dehydrogenase
LGAWAIGGGDWEFGWGPQADDDSIATIHRALELGVNWIDTAAAYGFGRSEQVVGQALDGLARHERPYVFTKASLLEGPGRTVVHNLTRDSILREADASLARLRVDAIDLYQIHWPVPERDIEQGWAALAELKQQGLVRHIGVSNFNAEQLERIGQIAPVETLQPPYSLIDRGIETELLPYAQRHGIGVIVYSPMASGLLTGAMTRQRIAGLPSDDWRKSDPRFQEPLLSQHLALVERLKAVAGRHGVTPGAVAVAWTLRHPAVSAAIVGVRQPDQVEPIVAAADLALDDTDLVTIEGKEPAMTTRTLTTIGFIGLGNMGGAMASRLLAAGYPVAGMSRTRERAAELEAQGLQWCDTARAAAGAAELVFTSLPDDQALTAVATEADGLLAGLRPGTIWADLSTVSPQASQHLATRVKAQGATMLDAPVSGSVPQVQAGTLTIMVGGDRDAYLRVEPVLRELGTPHHIGANGQGLALKLAINISVAVQMLALAEGLQLAQQCGVDPKAALPVMIDSAIGSPMLKARAPLILDLPKEAWFDLGLMHKDISLALDAGRALRIPLPTTSQAGEVLTQAHQLGYDRRDLAALFEVLQQITARQRANT